MVINIFSSLSVCPLSLSAFSPLPCPSFRSSPSSLFTPSLSLSFHAPRPLLSPSPALQILEKCKKPPVFTLEKCKK